MGIFHKYLVVSLSCISMFFLANIAMAKENNIASVIPAKSNIADAKEFVTKISEEILSIVRDKTLSDSSKEDEFSKLFDRYIDTNWMGQFILGKYNRIITNEERSEYISLYHQYLKHSYIPKFKLYSGEGYDIVRVKEKGRGNFLVNVDIVSSKAKSKVKVDYRLNYNQNRGFVIRDIVGEGVSLIVTQRSDFGAMIKRKGIKYFIQKLAEKVENMKNASVVNSGNNSKDKKISPKIADAKN